MVVFAPWTGPTYDAELRGFDKDFLYVQSTNGYVAVQPDSLTLAAPATSRASTILATSQVNFLTALTAIVRSEAIDSIPLRLMVYAPTVPVNLTLELLSMNHSIVLSIAGTGGMTVSIRTTIGSYSVGDPLSITLDVKVVESIGLSVSNSMGRFAKLFNGREYDPLLRSGVRAIMVDAQGGGSPGTPGTLVTLGQFETRIPHSPWLGPKTQDWRVYPLFVIFFIISIMSSKSAITAIQPLANRLRKLPTKIPRRLWVLVSAAMLLRLLLFGLGRHPYDVFVETVWTRDIIKEGFSQLYLRPAVTPAAAAFGGTPYLSAFFPYPPFLGFLLAGAATINVFSLQFASIESAIKLLSALADCVGVVIVYLMVRRLGSGESRAIAAAGIFGFAPGLVYDSAIWGETDSFLLMLLLLASYALLSNHDSLFWSSAVLALLTKQTAFVPVAVMTVLFFASKGFRKALWGFGTATFVSALVLAPFLLAGYSPFILVSQLIQRVSEFTVGQTPFGTPISADAYSFLPLLSGLSGLSGRDRMWASDLTTPYFIPLSYQTLGEVFFLGVSLPVLIYSLRDRQGLEKHRGLALTALITFLSFFFPTRVSGRYFVIATGLLIPSLLASRRKWAALIPVALSATTFISMHGLLVYFARWIPGVLSGFAYSGSLSTLILSFYLSDIGMSVAIVINLALLILGAITLVPYLSIRRYLKAESATPPGSV